MSSLQAENGKGYFAALVGGFGGAIAFLVLFIALAKEYVTQLQSSPNSSVGTALVIGTMIGITGAEGLGCWFALHWRRYRQSRLTAAWLVALFIPGWIIYFMLSLVLGGFVSALLLLISLPLIARAFTNNPNISRGIARAVHTNAKRPPSY
jgi:peptidoglycan biosynthesis protein MviN/MurJ (putative lipid II flippase)